jgi:bla regulator protein blaR1
MRQVPHFVNAAAWIALSAVAAAQAPGAAKDAATAQVQDANSPFLAFDAVSIKPNGSSGMMIRVRTTPDGVSVEGMPMHMILREALGTTNNQLLHEPDWVNAKRYDIEAKVAAEDAPRLKELTQQQRWAMLLPVFEDRCGLKFHHETRDLTVYDLVIAKGGLKMKESDPNESAPGPQSGPPGPPPPPPGAASGVPPGPPGPGQTRMTANGGGGGMTMFGHASPMAAIVRTISMTVGSTVVDKTGLTGKYDYTLQFAPDESMRPGMPPPSGGGGAPPPDMEGPSIFAALQEQLGLKLEAHKEQVDVVVIDHMEEPTAN